MGFGRREFLVGGVSVGAAAALPIGLRSQPASFKIPIRLTDRRVLVDCYINSRGPLALVIDTGGALGLMDERAVEQLDLRKIGSKRLAIHGRRRSYDIVEAEDLHFGGVVRQRNTLFAKTDNVTFHDGAIGSISAAALTAMPSELDFEKLEWRLHHEASYAEEGWHRTENAFVGNGDGNGAEWIFSDIGIGGQRFRIGLDTGAPSELRLSGDAMRASGLWDTETWAPGGPDGKGRVVRIPRLEFGGTELSGVIANLYPDSQFEKFDNGLVGLPILRRFHIATQPKDRSLLMKRNALPDPAPSYNRAGIWVERDDADLRVVAVGPGSPAALAGITVGDRLVGADFRKTIDAMLRPAGSKLPLEVRSGKKVRNLTLILADYL